MVTAGRSAYLGPQAVLFESRVLTKSSTVTHQTYHLQAAETFPFQAQQENQFNFQNTPDM